MFEVRYSSRVISVGVEQGRRHLECVVRISLIDVLKFTSRGRGVDPWGRIRGERDADSVSFVLHRVQSPATLHPSCDYLEFGNVLEQGES